MIEKLQISREVLAATLIHLKQSGERRHEGVVLWLGCRTAKPMRVTHVYQPAHRAAGDFFHIPANSMRALMDYLDQHEISVLAQVHTHPTHAFHSKADDQWALVRHIGALSLVIPFFAASTNTESFMREAAVFVLSSGNKWEQVPQNEIGQMIEVAP